MTYTGRYRQQQATAYKKKTNDNPFVQYLSKLPFDDIPTALSLALGQLKRLNREHHPPTLRMEYLRPFLLCYKRFYKHFHPARDSGHYHWHLSDSEFKNLGDFAYEMQLGFKLLAKDVALYKEQTNELAHFIFLSIYFLSHYILCTYEQYYWVPEHIWKEIHNLYITAEKRGLLGIKHRNPIDNTNYNTISQLYAKICLTTTADPYRLSKGEIWAIFDYCHHMAPYIEIVPPIMSILKNDHWIIDLNSSSRPQARLIAEEDIFSQQTSRKYIRYFSLNTTQELVNQHIFALERGEDLADSGLTLPYSSELLLSSLKHLNESWEQNDRHHSRETVNEEVLFVWGLPNIHSLLQFQQGLQKDGGVGIDQSRACNATLENFTNDGFGVRIPFNAKEQLGLGEIVGIKRNNETFITLGTLQWTALDKNNHLNNGIKIIPGNPEPIYLSVPGDQSTESPAILLQPTTQHHHAEQPYQDPDGLSMNSLNLNPSVTDPSNFSNPEEHQVSFISNTESYLIHEELNMQLPGSFDEYRIEINDVHHSTGLILQYGFAIKSDYY